MLKRSCLLLLLVLLPSLLLAGCSSPPRAAGGGFDSDNPAALAYAIRRAGATRDPAAVPRLIDLLDHDDPTIRLLAIASLERITGREDRFGYHWHDGPVERAPAIERWAQAYRQGTIEQSPTQPAPLANGSD